MYKKYFILLKLLFPHYRSRIIWLHFTLLANTALELAGIASVIPFLFIATNPALIDSTPIINTIYNHLNFESVNNFITALGIMIFCFMALGNYFAAMAVVKIQQLVFSVAEFLSVRLFHHYLNLGYFEHLQGNSAQFIKNILQETSRVANYLLGPYLQISSSIIVMSIVVVGLLFADPLLTLLLILFFALSFGGMFFFLKPLLIRNSDKITTTGRDQYSAISQAFAGIKTVKLYESEDLFVQKFRKATHEFNHSLLRNFTFIVAPNYIVQAGTFGFICLVAIFLTTNEDYYQYLPTVLLFTLGGYKLLPALRQIYSNAAIAGGHISAFDSIVDILGTVLQPDADSEPEIEGSTSSIEKPLLPAKFEGLCFSYDGENNVLVNIDLEICKGEILGITGPSGGGKTTFVDILSGLIEPTSGNIYMNGELADSGMLKNWRSHCSYVAQDTFLVEGSIKENIVFGLDDTMYNDEQIVGAVSSAGLTSYVNELAEKVLSPIGENGKNLSGGQKQRVGIARAFLRDAELYIFDEATNSLDSESEQYIIEQMISLSKKSAVIVISHNLEILKACTRTYSLEQGKITINTN